MNAVSEIDARNAEKEDNPDIILGDDWDDGGDDDSDDDSQPDDPRFYGLNRSPLARKIVTFNLIGLVVLVAGILFLNPFRDDLVENRQVALEHDAKLVAAVFEAGMPRFGPVDLAAGDGIRPREILAGLDLVPGTQAYVFDTAGVLVAQAQKPAAAQPPGSTLISDLMTRISDGATALLTNEGEPAAPKSGEDFARDILPTAFGGEVARLRAEDATGQQVFAVAVPLMRDGVVIGAVALTTTAGEIDLLVRVEREKVLQMFIVAILVSIGLSLVLANTIASPLSDLAQAAETGRARNARKLSPNRVRIPDMTARPDEIGRLSGALRGMVAALYDRIEANEQFAADVAHEIKNPLASLRSAVGTLRIAKNDVQREKLLDVIDHDVRRLDRLVSDISNASRLDSELVKESMEPFNLVMTLNNIAAHQRQEADEKGIDFIADLPDDPIVVHGLEARLAQVFVNLISNAISFCKEGDAVRIWARKRENRVLVVVEDTGPGIPEAALTKIFSRFYSERPPDDFGNHSGLGLAISKQIVEAHGGVIWAENIKPTEHDPDSTPLGARFVVGLPV